MASKTIGVIGAGSIGRMHIRSWKELGARVAVVSSRRADQAALVAREEGSPGCAATTDPQEVLGRPDVDLVAITTSSGSHAALALAAIAAGKHVVIEKPMAMTAAEARAIITAAKARGVLLSVISQRRFEPVHQAVKRTLESGALGRLLLLEARCPYYRSQDYYDSADWRGTIAQDGGALMNQSIHSVDLLLWLGGSAREVVGRTATQTHRMEAEDLALGLVTFANGALGSIMASTSIRPGFLPTLDLYGEHGSIKLEGAAVTHWTVPGVEMPSAAGPASAGTQGPALASHEHHRAQLADVLEALESGRAPAVTGEDGLRAVELVEGVYRSAASGGAVVLEGMGGEGRGRG
jgi:UDP-N-acetyl-2-amino-2-deoxyglucuronate dehydrogenase